MNVNHMDAQAVMQPGGLYASANNGILEALKAYFQFKDRQQAGERDMRRDERTMGRQQLNDALSQAERYGVRPTNEQVGWTDPAKLNPLLDAAQGKFGIAEANRLQAEADAKTARARGETTWTNQLTDRADGLVRKKIADIESGARLPDVSRDDYFKDGLKEVPPDLQEQWAASDRARANKVASLSAAQMKQDLLSSEILKNKAEAERALREKPTKWLPFGDSGMVGLLMEDGYTAVRFPGSDTPAQYLTPQGGMMTADQYKAMKASLGQAVGASVQPGVDSGAPAASVPAVPGQATSTDQLITASRSLPAPSADVLARNAAADYDSVNRRGVTEAVQPQEVRALVERMRMRKSQPSQHTQASLKPTDAAGELIAAYVRKWGGTPETAKAALVKNGAIKP
jgi:hypothetical protein